MKSSIVCRLLAAAVMFGGNFSASAAPGAAPATAASVSAAQRPPNIIYILADDLGYGELGCYGQDKIKTPNIDALAREGMRFTQHYCGNAVCAPSRCCLLSGLHPGHAFVRDNREIKPEGQIPVPPGELKLPIMMHQAGYRVGAIGKWGLGGPGSTGVPNSQGVDDWFGYLCQAKAHSYYPAYLWRNADKVELPENAGGKQATYSIDLMDREVVKFLKANRDRQFFLYLASTLPHVSLQAPADSVKQYAGKFPETPQPAVFDYTACDEPHATYAAMITRLDDSVGKVMALVKEMKLDDDTLVFFSSDNGPTSSAGVDPKFFKSAGPWHGGKGDLYEGGIHIPLVARWPGHIAPGTVSDHVSAFWDMLPTLAELVGAAPPAKTDGISFLPALLGRSGQKQHEYLYWEYPAKHGQLAVRMGDWKGVRLGLKEQPPTKSLELYDLKNDPGELHDVAAEHPEIVKKINEIIRAAHVPSAEFPLRALDQPADGAK